MVRLVVSWLLVGIGVPFLVRAELGLAPLDVLNSGISEVTGWSFGLCFVLDSLLFFGIGAGAILQVIVEVTMLIVRRDGPSALASATGLGGIAAGLVLMYTTALLV